MLAECLDVKVSPHLVLLLYHAIIDGCGLRIAVRDRHAFTKIGGGQAFARQHLEFIDQRLNFHRVRQVEGPIRNVRWEVRLV